MQSLDIQGFSYEERQGLLPSLTSAFADCGGWILNRKTLSPTTMEFRVEIQLRAVIDLYASIISSGLELTRAGHLGFTHLCTCRKNLTTPADLGQIITIRLEISFLEDATLQSLFLSAGSAPESSFTSLSARRASFCSAPTTQTETVHPRRTAGSACPA
ncbi:hypothetical protein [Tunturiibacter gelidiferens]|uniref:hypothetical protein n=1 Tax=Tunturiibacter gelidiferens TaxID=3069689 RepID=UPI003D9B8E50